MHERDRAERRFADRRARERSVYAASTAAAPDDGGLHQEVVRMLTIDERKAVERLADLKDVAVAVVADRRGIEAEHEVERRILPLPARVSAMPIHQFSTPKSVPPRGPP